jgi:hypothetical protein
MNSASDRPWGHQQFTKRKEKKRFDQSMSWGKVSQSVAFCEGYNAEMRMNTVPPW